MLPVKILYGHNLLSLVHCTIHLTIPLTDLHPIDHLLLNLFGFEKSVDARTDRVRYLVTSSPAFAATIIDIYSFYYQSSYCHN